VQLVRADAQRLPFRTASFDAVICECALCLLDKEHVLREMARVTMQGGYVCIHELCWRSDTPDRIKRTLNEIEHEMPEPVEGWRLLFAAAGLTGVRAIDRSSPMSNWISGERRRLGSRRLLKIALSALKRWGLSGLQRIWRSERVFSSPYVGYCIIAGRKP
jgi:SAM-dependent methyltransferase